MRDPKNAPVPLTSTIQVKVEPTVSETLKEMAKHTKISEDEITNTALKRFIATHQDYLPKKRTASL